MVLLKGVISSIFVFLTVCTIAQNSEQIIAAYKASYEYETNGEYFKAISEIKKVYDENSYELNLRLGWLNYEFGSFTESIANYNKAIGLMPYSIEARFGIIYPAYAMGNTNQVINQYQKILEVAPENTTALYKLGMIHYGKEQYDLAFKQFEKVVNLFPFTYDSVLMLGWCYYRLGKMREAKVLFEKVLMLSPDDASALEGLALVNK